MIEKPQNGYISEDDLIEVIVSVLRTLGGRAAKDRVVKIIWERFASEFQHPYYQESLTRGVIRWRHYIAWAKEQAKHQGLIQWPLQSGRGVWALTEKGLGKAAA